MPARLEPVAIAHDRHDEALVRADGDAEVIVIFVDDIGAVDLGVDGGHLPQRGGARLHEKSHEAEFYAVLLFECVLVTGAQGHDFGHVGLVEGRQHGGGILRVLEPPRDGLAQPRHRHTLLAILL